MAETDERTAEVVEDQQGRAEAGPEERVAPEERAAAESPSPEEVAAPGRAADGEGREGEREAGAPGRIEFLGNIQLEAAVELGRAELAIGEILKLGPGSVVELDKALGDPVELMVKDQLIARGEVVLVEDRFGLRVTEVVGRERE
jgi:flagellar motor switch protein FliN/FliY